MKNHKIYKNRGVRVNPRSKENIKGLANAFRTDYAKINLHERINLLQLIEIVLPKITNLKFEFILVEKEEMGDVEAAMSPDRMKMYIRNDVYDQLHQEDPRARFTIAHEIGHFVLHDEVTLTRSSQSKHEPFRDSEWQADCFAAELLAPIQACKEYSTIEDIMNVFGISYSCAQIRFNETKN